MAIADDHSTNKNYQNLLENGRILFWKHGIRRVTVEEICREAGVSKMTFYKFFPNKVELAKSILQQIMEAPIREFHDLIRSNISFQDKIQRMLLMKMKATEGISVEFLNDMYKNPDLGLLELMESYKEKSKGLFVDFLIDAKAKGLIRKDIRIEFVVSYINYLTQLVLDQNLQAKYDNPQELIMESMNFMFYGLLAPDDQ